MHTRTVSPSVHPRPASGGATNFFLASALVLPLDLAATGREDTRCDRPMSATQTNYVHPHLARSQLALATFAAGTPHRVLGSMKYDWGTGCFTTPETALADRHFNTSLVLYCLTAWRHERGRFLPTELNATEPLTPLSRPLLVLTPLPPSRKLPSGRRTRLLVSSDGSEDARVAKTTVDAFS